MALVKTVEKSVFDTKLVNEGDLIYVGYVKWIDPILGIVIRVSERDITILYHPKIANVTNRHVLRAEAVVEGGYTIRWTSDLVTVNEYSSVVEDSEEEGGGNDA